jgi:hypothetical protein
MRIWRDSNPHAVIEGKIQRRNVNVFCAVSIHTEVLGPFSLAELTVALVMYLDVLEEFLMSILEEAGPIHMLFHPPCFHISVRAGLLG